LADVYYALLDSHHSPQQFRSVLIVHDLANGVEIRAWHCGGNFGVAGIRCSFAVAGRSELR
jgi:hypothetical protein